MARDIPGIVDILFPRLSGGLVAALNRGAFRYKKLEAVSEELIGQSSLQNAMLFELAVARAELLLDGQTDPAWPQCISIAIERQRRHYAAREPDVIEEIDQKIANHAANNLVEMLLRISEGKLNQVEKNPPIPGMGWIASGAGDFSVGSVLVEVKHTDRNFVAGDFRQVLVYWLLKYANAIERNATVWTDCLLLNPRRNVGLALNFDKLLQSASSNANRVELCELLRSIVEHEVVRR
ncbi:hypothetical protein [Amaricoccus tamworthensis]|uniref:hypothetical protein n=1 Tax=Amaricoccus tamworthensis TaxID=57002 RepID=UPI003C7BCDEC